MDPSDALFRRLEAVTALYATLDLSAPLPPLGDWAIDPLFAVALVNVVLDRRPRVVLECGSGASTVVLAAALRRHGIDGHVTSLDQDPEYAEVTRTFLARHDLTGIATVHTAPIRDGREGAWYDTAALDGITGEIDLLVVDGPSTAAGGPLARYPALPVLHGRLATGALVLVDDALRAGEQEALKWWASEYPDVTFTYLLTQNGAALGTKT